MHIPMHPPRGLGPPSPPRNISGGQIQSLSEPPWGLRPCASPPKIFPGTQRILGNQNRNQNLPTIYTPNSPVITNLFLQNPENAGAHDYAPLRTAAPYKRPVDPPTLTPCMTLQPSTQGPAKITCSLTQHLIKFPPKYHCSQALNIRQESSARGGMAMRCGLET